MRGLTDVVLICPKFGALATVVGLLNCAWLKALKNSVRNCSVCPSRIGNILAIDMSQLFWPGPRTIPPPALPKPVPPVFGPVTPTVGGRHRTPDVLLFTLK